MERKTIRKGKNERVNLLLNTEHLLDFRKNRDACNIGKISKKKMKIKKNETN